MEQNQAESDVIVIRFVLQNGDGGIPPEGDEMSEAERLDSRRCISFTLDWDSEMFEDDGKEPPRILAIDFLYDGLTTVDGLGGGFGFDAKADTFIGTPCPILRFTLDRKVDPELFKRSVALSSLKVTATSRHDDPYFVEDRNGYTRVLSPASVNQLLKSIGHVPGCTGKAFTFPNGMDEHGHCFDAVDFAWHASMAEYS